MYIFRLPASIIQLPIKHYAFESDELAILTVPLPLRRSAWWRGEGREGETPTPGPLPTTLLKLIIIVPRYEKKVKTHNMEGPRCQAASQLLFWV